MIAARGVLVLPGVTETIDIGRTPSLAALDYATENNLNLFVAAQKDAEIVVPFKDDIYTVGTIVKIKQMIKLPNNIARIIVQGKQTAVIKNYTDNGKFFEVEVEPTNYINVDTIETEVLLRKIMGLAKQYIVMSGRNTERLPEFHDDANIFANRLATQLLQSIKNKQALLEEMDTEKRLLEFCGMISHEIEIAKIDKIIAQKVKTQIDKSQKEYYLREQMRAISEELGEGEDERNMFEQKIKDAHMPPEVQKKAEAELRRLLKMGSSTPDANVSRTYIDWLCDIKWDTFTTDNKDMKKAREILDEDHFGMEKIKQRVLEYLAVMNLTQKNKAPILCFVGPPGVGKTSIVKSIARALDRKYVRMSLGGLRDEAELRGHRRTYVGAIPGKIIYLLKQAGCMNPVFLFDEIDKMASDYKGDPTSAMLEVLDPEQNNSFVDHYMEVPVDLSNVLFVATANDMDSIPTPLLDRMEIIELSGYTDIEKLNIAKRFLLPKQKEMHGLENKALSISDDGIDEIINHYTRESGVRNLEREIATVCRKSALEMLEEGKEEISVEKDNVEKYLGAIKYRDDTLDKKDEVGSVTGLAWTPVGGTILTIDVTLFKGKGEILLTGQLGDVMKESARTAISLVRTLAPKYGIKADVFDKTDIHVHVPEGAVPKDGPSAGVTMATAILSAFANIPVSKKVAMTGEITLRGKVLAIGGLKEKTLAAYRMGIKKVIIPKQNQKDIEEIPAEVREKLEIILAEEISTVFDNALVNKK
ncbi:MAG: endopeptidase La [Clostridia bacterium]|nr:endopeptidase La [Clostridia bacterium]